MEADEDKFRVVTGRNGSWVTTGGRYRARLVRRSVRRWWLFGPHVDQWSFEIDRKSTGWLFVFQGRWSRVESEAKAAAHRWLDDVERAPGGTRVGPKCCGCH